MVSDTPKHTHTHATRRSLSNASGPSARATSMFRSLRPEFVSSSSIVDVVVNIRLFRCSVKRREKPRNLVVGVQMRKTRFIMRSNVGYISWNRLVDNRVTARPVIATVRSQKRRCRRSTLAVLAAK